MTPPMTAVVWKTLVLAVAVWPKSLTIRRLAELVPALMVRLPAMPLRLPLGKKPHGGMPPATFAAEETITLSAPLPPVIFVVLPASVVLTLNVLPSTLEPASKTPSPRSVPTRWLKPPPVAT